MIGINDELEPLNMAVHVLLILLPFLWFRVGSWQKNAGLVIASNITYVLAVLFILIEILLLIINYELLLLSMNSKIIVVVLALPVNIVLLAILAITSYVHIK